MSNQTERLNTALAGKYRLERYHVLARVDGPLTEFLATVPHCSDRRR